MNAIAASVRRRATRPAVAAVAAFAVLVAGACRDTEPWLAVTNTSADLVVGVRVGGDRVLILQPGETQYLPLSPAVWAWPRRIEVYRYPAGPRLLVLRADLNDLADNHWRLRVP